MGEWCFESHGIQLRLTCPPSDSPDPEEQWSTFVKWTAAWLPQMPFCAQKHGMLAQGWSQKIQLCYLHGQCYATASSDSYTSSLGQDPTHCSSFLPSLLISLPATSLWAGPGSSTLGHGCQDPQFSKFSGMWLQKIKERCILGLNT